MNTVYVLLHDIKNNLLSKKLTEYKSETPSHVFKNIWTLLFKHPPPLKSRQKIVTYLDEKNGRYILSPVTKNKTRQKTYLIVLEYRNGAPITKHTMVTENTASSKIARLWREFQKYKHAFQIIKKNTAELVIGPSTRNLMKIGALYGLVNIASAGVSSYREARKKKRAKEREIQTQKVYTKELQAEESNCEKELLDKSTELLYHLKHGRNDEVLSSLYKTSISLIPKCRDRLPTEGLSCVDLDIREEFLALLPNGTKEKRDYVQDLSPGVDSIFSKIIDGHEYTVKIQSSCSAYNKEIIAMRRMVGSGVTPKIYDTFICIQKRQYGIRMEKLDKSLLDCLNSYITADEHGTVTFDRAVLNYIEPQMCVIMEQMAERRVFSPLNMNSIMLSGKRLCVADFSKVHSNFDPQDIIIVAYNIFKWFFVFRRPFPKSYWDQHFRFFALPKMTEAEHAEFAKNDEVYFNSIYNEWRPYIMTVCQKFSDLIKGHAKYIF